MGPSPRKTGRHLKLCPKWKRVKFEVMEAILLDGFTRNPDLGQKLLDAIQKRIMNNICIHAKTRSPAYGYRRSYEKRPISSHLSINMIFPFGCVRIKKIGSRKSSYCKTMQIKKYEMQLKGMAT